MGKYIIEIPEDKIAEFAGSSHLLMPYMMAGHKGLHDTGLNLIPYTEPDLEQVREEAYQRGYCDALEKHCEICEEKHDAEEAYQQGLNDVWECARKISSMDSNTRDEVFGLVITSNIFDENTASEAIEKIRQYEREKEQSFTTEEVMRQYLDTFCTHSKSCVGCPLRTTDFTCGRGYHFLGKNPVSDEEVRRAYAKVVKEK